MPQYIELTTDDELEQALEWLGRVYARKNGLPYPMVPDWWSPGRQPDDPSTIGQRYYRAPMVKEDDDSGGVIEVDDTMLSWAADAETLSDGTSYTLDVQTRKKPLLLCSVKGRRAVNNIPTDIPALGKIRQFVQRIRKRRAKP